MKKIFFLSILITLAVALVTGCSKTSDTSPAPHVKAVYAAGYHQKSGKYYTTLWKDGQASVIDSNATPYDIFVNGQDFYIAGQKNNKGIFWKNGQSTQLNTDAAYGYVSAYSLYVNGTDLHITGMAENATTFSKHAVYWKNNVPTILNAGANTENAYAQSIAVSGSDVYIAGYRTIIGGGISVVVWKNGIATDLISSPTIIYGNVNLYVSGSDVYVTCYEYDFPNAEQIRLWKNGAPVTMPVSALGAVPYCLFVNGSDVYIGGFEREGTPANLNRVAKYWKNGTSVTVWDSPNGTDIVRSIYADGNDLYVAGVTGSAFTATNPVMWKNGVPYSLSGTGANPYGEVYSVFVK